MASSINDIAEAYHWSISQIARAFRMDRKTVARRLEDSGVRPAGKKGGYPVYALHDVGPALFDQSGARGGLTLNPDEMLPKDLKDWYQAQNERLKYESGIGQLVPAHDARREMSVMAKGVANTLDTLPDILERDCGLSAEVLNRVQDVIDAQREQMYLRIIENDGEEK